MMRGLGGRSPAKLATFLEGIDFPANKQQRIDGAEQNGAPEAVMDELGRLPEQEYRSIADVMKAYGQVR